MVAEERLIKASTLLKAIDPDKVTWRFGVPNTLDTMVDFLRLIINEQPAVDAVEVVRCKDCIYYEYGKGYAPWCNHMCGLDEMGKNDFCSYGERRSDDH